MTGFSKTVLRVDTHVPIWKIRCGFFKENRDIFSLSVPIAENHGFFRQISLTFYENCTNLYIVEIKGVVGSYVQNVHHREKRAAAAQN